MKKRLFVLFLILASCLSLSAAKIRICVCPNNDEIVKYVKGYIDSDVVSFNNTAVEVDDLLSGDARLLEYIKSKTDADFLIIPSNNAVSDYKYIRLFVYNYSTGEYSKVYEVLQRDEGLSMDFAVALNEYFNSFSEIKSNTVEKTFINHKLAVKCKNTVADIYINDEYIGKTPLEISELQIPAVIRFCSEGFADRSYAVTDNKLSELNVTLIEENIANPENFIKSQNNYYRSFALFILGWGSRIAVKAMNISNPGVDKLLNYVSLGLASASTVYLGYNIYDYFKSTQNTTP